VSTEDLCTICDRPNVGAWVRCEFCNAVNPGTTIADLSEHDVLVAWGRLRMVVALGDVDDLVDIACAAFLAARSEQRLSRLPASSW
jgi:hypothetical protein